MNDYNDVKMGERILPGVDLTLWLRLIVALLLAVAVGGIALAVA
jgi:hypothetical protein